MGTYTIFFLIIFLAYIFYRKLERIETEIFEIKQIVKHSNSQSKEEITQTQPIQEYKPSDFKSEIKPQKEILSKFIPKETESETKQTIFDDTNTSSESKTKSTRRFQFLFDLWTKNQTDKIENTVTVLGKLKNWLLYGDEDKPSQTSNEIAIASTWLLRIGVIAILFGVGFFLKWSIDNEILGPNMRVLLGVFTGLGMIGFAYKIVHTRYHLIAQGFFGGGIATLYFSIFAAGQYYNLISLPLTFFLMISVTILAGTISIITDSLLIAILGIMGGFLTPLILSTGSKNYNALFAYLLILNLCILGIAHFKKWRLLNYIGFIFTYGIFLEVNTSEYKYEFNLFAMYLTSFFILHSFLVNYYKIIQKEKSTAIEIVHLFLNAVVYFSILYELISISFTEKHVAIATILLSLFYLSQLFIYRSRQIEDRHLSISLTSLTLFFIAITIPIYFEKEVFTFSWAIFSFILLFMGYKLDEMFLLIPARISYLILMLRILTFEIPNNLESSIDSDYWTGFFKRFLSIGISAISLFGGFVFENRFIASMDSFQKMKYQKFYKFSNLIMFWFGLIFLFFFLHFEGYSAFIDHSYRIPFYTLIWTLLIYFLVQFGEQYSPLARIVGLFLLLILVIKYFGYDFINYSNSFDTMIGYSKIYFLSRTINFTIIIILFYALYIRNQNEELKFKNQVLLIFSFLIFFHFMTYEVKNFCYYYLPNFQKGAISILWSIIAISFLTYGIQKNEKSYRYTGLILFTIVVFKVFLVDMDGMETSVRLLASMVIGILLLFGSFLYIRANQ